MKKVLLFLTLLFFTVTMFPISSSTEELKEITTIEYMVIADLEGVEKCYARSCVETSDPYGNEYKRCSEWEEVPCSAIVPAKAP